MTIRLLHEQAASVPARNPERAPSRTDRWPDTIRAP